MPVILQEPFTSLWQDTDPFVAVEALEGEVYRALEGRRTFKTTVAGADYFVKIHRGIGWREIIKNLLTAKCPVLGAQQEWRAIARLTQAQLPTMSAVAFGVRGSNPARQHSFIITRALAPTTDLEVVTQHWTEQPPAPTYKRALLRAVAELLRGMHQAGVNHRDCYLCHFLLHTDGAPTLPKLSIIDLHRAQTRRATPVRWRNKDLAALYFSALEIGLTKRDLWRFLVLYFQAPTRTIWLQYQPLLKALEKKAQQLYARKQRYGDEL